MLSSLAGLLQDANLVSSCRRLFVRALEYDPDNPAALLGLAATFEKYGEYQQALTHLEHLVAVAPELDEAKLRLAVGLNRVGLRRRARELLEGLVESGPNEWVRAVAYEEIGRILLQTGAVAAAAELLEEAMAAMPSRQALRVLAAHAYGRLGMTEQALEHLAAVIPAGRRALSERLEYDRWPHGELDRIHRRLAGLGRQTMAALRDVVGEDGQKQRDVE